MPYTQVLAEAIVETVVLGRLVVWWFVWRCSSVFDEKDKGGRRSGALEGGGGGTLRKSGSKRSCGRCCVL